MTEHRFKPLSYLLLTPVFFASIGISITVPSLNLHLVLFTVVFLAVAIVSKLVGCGIGAKMCKMTVRESVQVGFGMVCRGEVALIVAQKGRELGLFSDEYFGPIIIMVVFTTVITPMLLKLVFAKEDKYEGLKQSGLVDRYEAVGHIEQIENRLSNEENELNK
jgi:Kef-type K+ transport system membrane component KefB